MAHFAFFLTEAAQLAEPERNFTLSPEQIAAINPNTRTAPVFRSRRDAELTAKIYHNVPVLIDEAQGPSGNHWALDVHSRFIHVTENSAQFGKLSDLDGIGLLAKNWIFHVDGSLATDSVKSGRWLPLHEGEFGWNYDHRFATNENGTIRATQLSEHSDPRFECQPTYWIHESFFQERVARRNVRVDSHIAAMRRVSSNTNERTIVCVILPFQPVTYGWIMLLSKGVEDSALFVASLNSLVVDYCLRNKISQASIPQGTVYQLPILSRGFYETDRLAFVAPRVLELSYTSHSLAPFAHDLGYDGPPFPWDEERRAYLRAELDAFYARAYGLTLEELRYVLDPADVLGPDYPSETFRVLKQKEKRQYDEYRTQRLVLAAWHRMEADGTFRELGL